VIFEFRTEFYAHIHPTKTVRISSGAIAILVSFGNKRNEQTKKMNEIFTKEYWESLKHFENEHDIPDIPLCRTDEEKAFYKDVIVPNLIRCGAIAKKDLEVGSWYLGDTRNTTHARWNGTEFEYLRFKWGNSFLDTINHFEDDNDYAIFVPIKKEESVTTITT
jgi:hypothetical protein